MNYLEGLSRVFFALETTGARNKNVPFERAVSEIRDLIICRGKKGGQVIFIGNGGSAALASHNAVDLWKNGGVRSVAFNDASLLTCLSNDFGYEYVFAKPIQMFAEAGDIVIAISSSGESRNILRAVDAAAKKRCAVITMSGFSPKNPLRAKGIFNFYAPDNSYGYVEVTHSAISHCIIDSVIAARKTGP